VNLCWKIPFVLAGVCDEGLLETYAAERDAHAHDLVEWAVAIGKLMETLAAREAGRPDPHAAEAGAGYGQGRTVPPLRDGVLMTEQLAAKHPPGAIFAQPTVRGADGNERRLDEQLGRGFAVVGRTPDDLRIGDAARAIVDRLGVRLVSIEGLEAARGGFDRTFEAHPAVVVRPDRYVFGCVDSDWNLDRLLAELARRLELRA
jgi:3-(3-hydroxy-phenyl)propionate hydroxylase